MAPAPPEDLLTFSRSPLDEVVLGIQLQEELGDEAFALADFWPRIRKDFPKLDRQPPLPAVTESFEAPTEAQPTVEFVTAPIPARYWFISQDEQQLLQLQPDRFLLNWRKRQPTDTYPRYRVLRDQFRARIQELSEAAEGTAERVFAPSWCEISYINHVGPRGVQERQPLSDVLRLIETLPLSALGAPEDTQLQQRYIVSDPSGDPLGRVYLSVAPALRKDDGSPIYVLTLLARLAPPSTDVDAVMATFDQARRLAVETFRDVTTPEMHEAWGLETSTTPNA
jgi:uncharacterized protein (TIGR04255 family)